MSFNFLGEPSGDRIPITGVSKAFVCKCGCLGRCTFQDISAVIAWSFRALITGVHPSFGPKGEPLEDKLLLSVAGTQLGVKACLMQIRADWPFLKQLFGVPSWSNDRICWKCQAEKSADAENSMFKSGPQAPWRKLRVDVADFFRWIQEQNIPVSCLFSIPGFSLSMLGLDWLHIVDLGCAQDLLGNLFSEAVRFGMTGSNQKERLKNLWLRLREFYKEAKSPSRLDDLTLEMFMRPKKAPKLRAKGGETRHLMPFAAVLARELNIQQNTEHSKLVAVVFDSLLECAKQAATVPFNAKALAKASQKMSVAWSLLAEEATAAGKLAWVKKPKAHLFQELCEYQVFEFGSPELFWTYKDESWCGFAAKTAKRRGGWKRASTVPFRLLSRFRAQCK